jgi:hypothetical protein
MKSLIFSGLSVLMLSLAIAASTKAQSERISPFNLAHLARQGYFQKQRIPSYRALCAAVMARRVRAKDLVKAAIAKNRLSPKMLDDKSYLERIEVLLRRSCRRI